MLRRTGFKRPQLPTAEERREARVLAYKPAPVPSLRKGTMTGGVSGVPIPKGEKAKPGKQAPDRAEKAWMDAIVGLGCIACLLDGQEPRPTAVHHILRDGVRMGHMHTLPLCDPGHHQGGEQFGLVSRHPYKARFEAKYGSEEALLELVRQQINKPTVQDYEMTRKTTKRKVRSQNNPVARALALKEFRALVTEARIKSYGLEEGEDCTDLLADFAVMVGTATEAGMAHVGREPWVRMCHGALRTVMDLCRNGYQWREDLAPALETAMALAAEHLGDIPDVTLSRAMVSAQGLAQAIKRHTIQGDEVAGALG